MAITDMVKLAQHFAKANAPAILTGVGVAGVMTTALLTGRASFKAATLLAEAHEANVHARENDIEYTLARKVGITWQLYIPPAAAAGITIGSILMANRMNSKRIAALAMAWGISEKAHSQYRDKVAELWSKGKEQKVRDSIAQDRVSASPGSEIIILNEGAVLCYDSITGRYFESTVEKIRQAEIAINHKILNHGYESLSSFYDEIGLRPTEFSQEVGWNADNLLEISFSTTLSLDNRPCMVIDYVVAPRQGFGQLY